MEFLSEMLLFQAAEFQVTGNMKMKIYARRHLKMHGGCSLSSSDEIV